MALGIRLLLVCTGAMLFMASAVPGAEPVRGYAVVISKDTLALPEWKAVADELVKKHAATMFVYEQKADEVLPKLKEMFPRYICFVAQPTKIGRELVRMAHRIARSLDDDPYYDAFWGIITGYTPADAMKIAKEKEPLVIRTAAGGTGIPLDIFDEGMFNDEGKAGVYFVKEKGGKVEEKKGTTDAAERMANAFNTIQPQLFVTSGHATENDWQIGYSFPGGQFRCENGKLFALDTKGKKYPIASDKTKIYTPAGNCLIGHVNGRECIALAFMSSGGVRQMYGYTVVTFFGRAGWGTKDWLMQEPGRFSLVEAWFINQQTIMEELLGLCPKVALADIASFSTGEPGVFGNELFKLLGNAGPIDQNKVLGTMWDRDATAFYGDPAWDARLASRPLPYTVKVANEAGSCTITLRATESAKLLRPPAVLLETRVPKPSVAEGSAFKPLFADDFVILQGLNEVVSNTEYRVVLKSGAAKK